MKHAAVLCLPTAAKSTVELHETMLLVATRLRQSEFRGKERPLAVEHVEIGGRAALVAQDGEADRLRQVAYGLLLANSHLVQFLISDQCVGHIAESVLNGLLVGNQSLLVRRIGQMQVSAKCATRENGLSYLSAVGPDARLRAHHTCENTAAAKRAAPRAGQRYLWEERRFGDTDFGVRGDEHVLGLVNIGPSLEPRGRQPRGHFGGKWLPRERASAPDGLRGLANENADGIFLLADLSFEVRDLRIGGVEHLLSLKHIQLRGDAVVHSERRELDGILLGLHGVAGDLELQIKLQEHEVVTRHVADKREHDRALRIFRSQKLGARRFSFSAQLAEKIQLEGSIGGKLEGILFRLQNLFFFAP